LSFDAARVLGMRMDGADVHADLRLATLFAIASAVFYANAHWVLRRWHDTFTVEFDRRLMQRLSYVAGLMSFVGAWIAFPDSWTASFLLALLAWYELRSVSVAVAWVVGGLILFEVGFGRKSISLRLQAYLLFLSGFLRIFFVNLNAAGEPGEISPRVYTLVPMALAFFYAYWRLQTSQAQLSDWERKLKAPEFTSYLGTITIASLMRFEVEA